MRILISAQIHGHLEEFKTLLEHANYDSTNDKLILLGDYLNKGNKQEELIEYLIELQGKGAIILCGKYEEKYIDALVNNDTIAEQFLTSENNMYYHYLDNCELRKKHLKFLISLKDNYNTNRMFFSYEKQDIEGFQGYYCLGDIYNTDDFIEEGNSIGINFFQQSIGLMDISSRKIYKIAI